MNIKPLKLKGTYEINLKSHQDERGYFMRIYDEDIFREQGLTTAWVQENQSLSKKQGIIRGLHFQKPPHDETKLVRVIQGKILDVFVDLRKNSETYGQWDSIELSEHNQTMVYIPKGFAHGFCTLTPNVIVYYKVDSPYHPEAEGGLIWNDESISIQWPFANPFLSDKDSQLRTFKEFVSPFIL
ncbi:dTDP-4-dehydrorhamnose 3,5-epimerase [Planktothrix tepida]|uniref:dTDP-4-dehydrorhamnose 3,5-epimerase n=1 Tax=Planktothrix tepida PCC 9214 TaxID=671072 RepID=A0A1J1LSH4_9CYAN|nr:dTDP-4-dehydrorhamnose 3,5-epimerase [Planktothrix tepida]CAD5961990.1 dTDP-4-dehydrorhamnose 3,5-epimerase [Planktothrix tepida]CUR34796.1 dTDP-4-dehydrorhamnose 3,5-epimerase [Planktothrix tepida PCC 9214]